MGKTIEESGRPGSLRRRRGIGGVDSKKFVRQRELQAPGLAPQPAAIGKNEKIAFAVQNLLSGVTGFVTTAGKEIHELNISKDKKDLTKEIYDGLVKGKTAPDFRSQEGFAAYRSAMGTMLASGITSEQMSEWNTQDIDDGSGEMVPESMDQTLHRSIKEMKLTTDPEVFTHIYGKMIQRYAAHLANVAIKTGKKNYEFITRALSINIYDNAEDLEKLVKDAIKSAGINNPNSPFNIDQFVADAFWAPMAKAAINGEKEIVERIGNMQIEVLDKDGNISKVKVKDFSQDTYAKYVVQMEREKRAKIAREVSDATVIMDSLGPDVDRRAWVNALPAGDILKEARDKLLNIATADDERSTLANIEIMQAIPEKELTAPQRKFAALDKAFNEGLLSAAQVQDGKIVAIKQETVRIVNEFALKIVKTKTEKIKPPPRKLGTLTEEGLVELAPSEPTGQEAARIRKAKLKEISKKYLADLLRGANLRNKNRREGIAIDHRSYNVDLALKMYNAMTSGQIDNSAIEAAIEQMIRMGN